MSGVSLLGRIAAFVIDRKGTMAPVSATVILGAVGATAVALDGNTVRHTRMELQSAADASALAGAKALAAGSSVSNEAIELARVNLPVAEYGDTLTVPNVDVGGWNSATRAFMPGLGADAVRAKLEMSSANGNPLQLGLSSILGYAYTEVSATAVARLMAKPLCALALDPNGYGIRLEQNNDFYAANCTVWSNATHSQSIGVIHSSGQVHTGPVRPCAAGGVYGDTADFSAFPIRDCAQKADPLANAPLPIPGACDYNQKIQVLPKQGATFNPGVYCNDIEIRPNAEGETANSPIVFNPGVYIFKGGEFHINNNNEIEGHNVLFHFTEGASWIVESNVEADLTGLQSGAYAGLVVSQSRTDPGGEFDIRANTDFDLEGVVYLPRSTLGIGADTHLSINAPWVAFIVKGFRQYANSDIHLNIDFNLSNVPYPPELEQMFTTLVR